MDGFTTQLHTNLLKEMFSNLFTSSSFSNHSVLQTGTLARLWDVDAATLFHTLRSYCKLSPSATAGLYRLVTLVGALPGFGDVALAPLGPSVLDLMQVLGLCKDLRGGDGVCVFWGGGGTPAFPNVCGSGALFCAWARGWCGRDRLC